MHNDQTRTTIFCYHFKYALYNIFDFDVYFSCSSKNNKSLIVTRFNRGLRGNCGRPNTVDDPAPLAAD